MANKLRPKEPNPFDEVIAREQEARAALEQVFWVQSGCDEGLFNLLLRQHDLTAYISRHLDEEHPDWLSAQLALKGIITEIENYGEPRNYVDLRLYDGQPDARVYVVD